jgi:hypothetical protein
MGIYKIDYAMVEVVQFKIIHPIEENKDFRTEFLDIPQGEIIGNKIYGLKLSKELYRKHPIVVIGSGFTCIEVKRAEVPIGLIEELGFRNYDLIDFWTGFHNGASYVSNNTLDNAQSIEIS